MGDVHCGASSNVAVCTCRTRHIDTIDNAHTVGCLDRDCQPALYNSSSYSRTRRCHIAGNSNCGGHSRQRIDRRVRRCANKRSRTECSCTHALDTRGGVSLGRALSLFRCSQPHYEVLVLVQ
jgi:hypothetical protein